MTNARRRFLTPHMPQSKPAVDDNEGPSRVNDESQTAFPFKLIADKNSCRVSGRVLNVPNIQLVSIVTSDL